MKKAPKQTSLPLSKAVEGFMLAAAARGLSVHTVLDYQNTIKKLVAFLEGDPVIAEITVSQIREFLAEQAERISNKTLLNYHTGLSALWKWALDEKLVTENFVRNIPAPKPEDRRIIPFTEAEIKLLMGALERSKAYTRPGKKLSDHAIPGVERNRAIVFLLIDCGLRATELCELTIQNVDIRNHRVLVMGKGSKERLIPFSARTGQALWRYISTLDNPQPTDALFKTSTGGALDRDQLRRMLERLGERAKVDNVHPHRFRHTFAVQFLRNGGDPFTLQMLLGHSTLDMVKRYINLAQSDVEAAHRRASPVDNWRL